ncbi:DMT family transporter [Grimontia kaedaensis]|uniref:DMT family transporter n=1 Tax=Grimontia kaedaensis TaxID=2872157 RepID=A0ABY4WSP7_9GAMM|nr:DMT family transporter [Grimontia kaedaensis]USH01386.1 DMT family transporter [Grimontia kaedaensis]
MHRETHWSGLAMIFLAVVSATAMDAFIKLAGGDIGTWQLLFMRWIIGALVILPVVAYYWKKREKIKDRRIYYWRFALNLVGCYALFYSLANLPFATVITILFAEPIFIIPLAVVLLGEKISLKNVIASLVGFGAVFYINRPEDAGSGFSVIAPIVAALTLAIEHVLNKRLGSEENPQFMLFWLAVPLAAVSLPMTVFVEGWVEISAMQWGVVLLAAVLGNAYNYFIIMGFRRAHVATGSVLLYLSVPMAFIIGVMFFNEVPTLTDVVCGALILGASMLANMRRPGEKQRDELGNEVPANS